MSYDVIALGETMLRFTPPGFERFSQAKTFEVHVGGSESNTAVGLAKLGLRVAWLSRLTDNPLGHSIADEIHKHGVDTAHVQWTQGDRVGTYYLERGTSPRGSKVFYDRQGSAMSRMTLEDLPVSLFVEHPPKVFHTTGITLGISSSAAATAEHAATLAKQRNGIVSFDVNYRAKLWSPEAAAQGCRSMMQLADFVFIPIRDVSTLYGGNSETVDECLTRLAPLAPQATIVMTLGAEGSAARCRDGEIVRQPPFPVVEVERLGGGDAFSAGFLRGYLASNDVATALRWGNAVAALKYTINSDFPLVQLAEVESLLRDKASHRIIR